jgi:hypothetical protein
MNFYSNDVKFKYSTTSFGVFDIKSLLIVFAVQLTILAVFSEGETEERKEREGGMLNEVRMRVHSMH